MTTAAEAPEDRRQTRTRLIESAAALFSRQGYGGTGIKTVLADAEAPYGSLYHFFPGGKVELGAAALTYGAAEYRAQIEVFHPPGSDPVEATRTSFEHAAEIMVSSDYTHTCPVATTALEASSTHEPLRQAAAAAFDSWLDVLETRYVEGGIAPGLAHDLAVQCLCLMEGAVLLSRTSRSPDPLHIAGRAATALITAALVQS
ncbi:TetR/AcrR family transcriptional regulator [Gordonia sp. TBRC 11910]|uniref:TetR/AcrR family transcriptional regulator n=1 Tax=Gordonia asplenii TaxID=2725283 RepID=A0A848KZF6_9ACTN|nr:TetR/AcrR family transcriptional regulator [Gordonia asplenii]NMO03537.1 TetR/AcrR family transcriptional regulator [Gordonia asplenii]